MSISRNFLQKKKRLGPWSFFFEEKNVAKVESQDPTLTVRCGMKNSSEIPPEEISQIGP